MTTIADYKERERALHPQQSFIVQAPAGSGKTELLTQRVLVLLAHVNAPEEILSITFTKKASAEMRARIIHALKKAAVEPEPTLPHAKKTWELAKNALKQDAILGWNLLSNPNRLRIQTIDSFNASLVKYLPILSHFGAPPEITTDAFPLYLEAVQEFLSHLEENVAWSDSIAQLLVHMDNDINKVQDLLINMLAKRDQWLPYIMIDINPDSLREQLEEHLNSVLQDALAKLQQHFPKSLQEETLSMARFAACNLSEVESLSPITYCHDIMVFPQDHPADVNEWRGLSNLLLTNDFTWRKRVDKSTGFPAPSNADNSADKASYTEMKQRMSALIAALQDNEKLRVSFEEFSKAPAHEYQEVQWQALNALYLVLRVVVAQLKVVFQNHGKIDYIENAQAALLALGTEEAPTDLALSLDYQIRHILIDEFQDTSNSQYRLLEKLIAGWQQPDGRTLFIVGDPMQSIYRFREAEVGLFIRARKKGIGSVKLEPLTLSVNFRSTAVVVDWVNHTFDKVLPPFEDIATGAVSYSNCIANPKEDQPYSTVMTHPSANNDEQQAQAIVELIAQHKQEKPGETIAILVRSRTHLEYVIPALKKAKIPYRAIDIDSLNSRPVIQDMMALTRALLHPADRIAWLSILRAPWCGLQLQDLLVIAGDKPHITLWERLQTPDLFTILSSDGQQRLARILPVLQGKLFERRRYTLRIWVESTWLALGGPACVADGSDLEDVNAYLGLLDKLDEGGDVKNLANLDHNVSKLYASPNNHADNSLQIMTVHNAKGLEFDMVILPHLERKSPNDEKQLLLWMERPRENNNNALILAPVHATGQENDSIYEYIKRQHAIKNDYESGRLLYVAATRAKKQLHLFFTLKVDKEKGNASIRPNTKSLLEKLWPAVHQDVLTKLHVDTSSGESSTEIMLAQRFIKRLNSKWVNPLKEYAIPNSATHQKSPGFKLSEDIPKQVGTVVHSLLQQISRFGLEWWQNQDNVEINLYLRNHLSRIGMLSKDIDPSLQLISTAIENVLKDPRGQWILHAHSESQAEFALTTLIDKSAKPLVIDRTFVDENGYRWIIDYKTAHSAGNNIEEFLSSEQEKYAEKMQQYHQAIQEIDKRPIKLGLYFPLLSAWREWSIH